jgi:hypothetical protein
MSLLINRNSLRYRLEVVILVEHLGHFRDIIPLLLSIFVEQMCSKKCDRPKCNTPCIYLLNCGHKCPGLLCETKRIRTCKVILIYMVHRNSYNSLCICVHRLGFDYTSWYKARVTDLGCAMS